MTMTTLAEVATVVRGVSFDKSDVSDSAHGDRLPILRAGNIEGHLILSNDLVWVPGPKVSLEQRLKQFDIPICMSSGSPAVVGKSAILRHEWSGSVGAFCAIVRPKQSAVVPEYLAFFLQSPKFRAWTKSSSGSSIKNVKKSELEAYSFDLPDLSEQRRIVDLLSRTEGIVRLRREAQKKAAELVPAIFLEMFGDPAVNPKQWPVQALGELLISGPTNGLYKHKSKYGSGVPILRIDAFYDGVVRNIETLKRVMVDDGELRRFRLAEDDIIINRVNSPEYLGKSAVVPPLGEPTVFESNMMRLTVDPTRLCSDYMIALLQTKFAKGHFLANAKHAINQSSINQQDVKALQIMLPPLNMQRTFAQRVESVQSICAQQEAAIGSAQAAFGALLAKAFA